MSGHGVPGDLEKDVVLRDGRTVHLRPATAADEELVQDYLIGLSDETRRLRLVHHDRRHGCRRSRRASRLSGPSDDDSL